jgi:hypothetical protein
MTQKKNMTSFDTITGIMSIWSPEQNKYIPWEYSRFEAYIGATVYPSEYKFLTNYMAKRPPAYEAGWYDVMADACEEWSQVTEEERTIMHNNHIDDLKDTIEEISHNENSAMAMILDETYDCESITVLQEVTDSIRQLVNKYKKHREILELELDHEQGWGLWGDQMSE